MKTITLTKAQKWARERNTSKGQVSAMTSLCSILIAKKCMTEKERTIISAVSSVLAKILVEWKGNEAESRTKYVGSKP